ncbi:hypothetical protein HZH68_005857 [Vespula germanica]|uniref:Uncharacterized protein n=1 Tax=Vespula germanica TaxID=30212 RepID=A0A834NGE2_VESGE|nr:hypothetical protein HZH68_005857 [Vespula germanica]
MVSRSRDPHRCANGLSGFRDKGFVELRSAGFDRQSYRMSPYVRYPILVRGTTITTPALPPPPPPSPPPSPCHRHHHLPGSSVTDRLHLRRTEL